MITKYGTIQYIRQVSNMEFRNGKPFRLNGSLQDVTESMQREADLMKQNNTLREIAWVESHEVRRPLASILGLIELLKTPCSTQEKEELYEYMNASATELDQVSRKINRLVEKVI